MFFTILFYIYIHYVQLQLYHLYLSYFSLYLKSTS